MDDESAFEFGKAANSNFAPKRHSDLLGCPSKLSIEKLSHHNAKHKSDTL